MMAIAASLMSSFLLLSTVSRTCCLNPKPWVPKSRRSRLLVISCARLSAILLVNFILPVKSSNAIRVPNVKIVKSPFQHQRCARLDEILQNFSERQILWSFCLVLFHALTLKLPIQSSLSVVSKFSVSLSSAENCHKFSKTSTPQSTFIMIRLRVTA